MERLAAARRESAWRHDATGREALRRSALAARRRGVDVASARHRRRERFPALSRGLQGLLVRLARGLNTLWGRKGKVFADRYHDRALMSPREARNALVYVLGNDKKHASQGRRIAPSTGPERYTSAPWFDGFVEELEVVDLDKHPLPVTRARTWLAGVGWRRLGKIGFDEMPKVG